jgi:hypothetical protein
MRTDSASIGGENAPSVRQFRCLRVWVAVVAACTLPVVLLPQSARHIEIWHGNVQRVGHLGDAQDDFNIMGRVESWRELDTLEWRLAPRRAGTPLSFRAHRRLVHDGDFNADVPIGMLQPGANTITITARYRDGQVVERQFTLHKEKGSQPLPVRIVWSKVQNPQDVGQYVDGQWKLTPEGLRTAQTGYDRVFLIGERSWKDYEVKTSVTVHHVPEQTTPISGPNGLGLLLRFTGHVTGGPRHFPSGQPKFGYQPFGSIGWLRWFKDEQGRAPLKQFYPGDGDRFTNLGHFAVSEGGTYHMRYRCQTLPEDTPEMGVTRYSFKIWNDGEKEPADWTWDRVQKSATALRTGGVVLLAHHVDATFGDVEIVPVRGGSRSDVHSVTR